MNKIDKQAHKHATKIEWDTYEAFTYAYALLTECNMHTEAEALRVAHVAKLEEDEKFLASFNERPEYNND